MLKKVGEDKLVTRGDSGAVGSAFWLFLIALQTFFSRPKELWPFATLAIAGALFIVIRYGLAEVCTLDRETGTFRIKRIDVRGKHITERSLSEVVAVRVDKCYIPNRKRRVSYCVRLLCKSGECLELPGVVDGRYGKVLDTTEQVQRFLGLTEPVVTGI